jgi:hypothetical protein
MVPLSGLVVGCSGADNPQIAQAPPPPPPKPEELQPPKEITKGKTAYGSSSKYQKAMEGIDKQ